MTLAFDVRTARHERPRYQAEKVAAAPVPKTPDPDENWHEETYRKFTKRVAIAAFAVPFFLAFLLYWTT